MRRIFALSSAALLSSCLAFECAAQVRLTFVKTIDLAPVTTNPASPSYIGTNPSAVAFAAGEIYVAGFNSGNAAGNVGIVHHLKVQSGGSDFGPALGVKLAPIARGYSGLDIDSKAGTLFAAYDPGTTDPDGITAWNGLTGVKLWAKAARGSSGNAVDPGFTGGNPALGKGLGWLTLSAAGRALQNKTSGVDIWSTANGMSLATPQGLFFRDLAFDDITGDVWARAGNNVLHGARSGDNQLTTVSTAYDSVPNADFVNGQNLAFCRTKFGAFVIFNDRSQTTPNQPLKSVLKAIREDGSSVPIDFGAFNAQDGNGYYDFGYDSKSGLLVVLDFYNRKLYQFQATLVPFVTYGHGCAGFGGFVPELSFFGDPVEGNNVQLTIAKGLPGASAIVLLGLGPAASPLVNGCTLNLSFVLPSALGPLPLFGSTPGTGTITVGGPIPAGAAGATIYFQAFIPDTHVFQGYSNTAGVKVPIFAP